MKVWRSHIWVIIILLLPFVSFKSANSETERSSIERLTCPEDLQELTSYLLRDLPNYSNRVIQRTQRYNRDAGIRNFIVTAGKADFEPLNLPRIQYSPQSDRDPEQIFFTVLERQYKNGQVINTQTYHWLFLTPTDSGWRTVMMFSRFGKSPDSSPPTPPRETTDGIIGQAVQLWFQDCRAGTVRKRIGNQ